MLRAIAELIGRRAANNAVRQYLGSDAFAAKVREACDEFARKAIVELLAKPEYAWFRFVKQMQAKMISVNPTMPGRRAFDIALQAYKDFLREEKIEFGDDRYDWSAAGAHDLIQAMEIDHWERA